MAQQLPYLRNYPYESNRGAVLVQDKPTRIKSDRRKALTNLHRRGTTIHDRPCNKVGIEGATSDPLSQEISCHIYHPMPRPSNHCYCFPSNIIIVYQYELPQLVAIVDCTSNCWMIRVAIVSTAIHVYINKA